MLPIIHPLVLFSEVFPPANTPPLCRHHFHQDDDADDHRQDDDDDHPDQVKVLNIQVFPVAIAATFVTLSWNTSQSLSRDFILQASKIQDFCIFQNK